MNFASEITGIVLAGGRSTRMGRDKSQLLYKGRKLIDYPLEIFSHHCKEILVSSNVDSIPGIQYKIVKDMGAQNGPLSGIYACLKQSSNIRNIVLPCDMPLLTRDLVQHIIQHADQYDLVMPFYNGHFEPLCAMYSKSLITVMEVLFSEEDFSPLSLIPRVKFLKLQIDPTLDFFKEGLFSNFNTRSDILSV